MAEAGITVVIKALNQTGNVLNQLTGQLNVAAGETTRLSTLTRASNLFGGILSTVAQIGMATFAVQGLINAGRGIAGIFTAPVTAASDYNETVNKINEVFKGSAGAVTAFSASSATALGMSRNEALAAAGTFGNLFRTIGLGDAQSAQFSTNLLQNAADLSSFNNIDPSLVLEKLQAGLVGETEPLRALGIDVQDATVQLEAYRQGINKSTLDMTQAEKVGLRYALIQRQIGAASGDFARTATGQANATRIVNAGFADAIRMLGQGFQPAVAGVVNALALIMPAAVQAAQPLFAVFGQVATSLASSLIPVIQQLPSYLAAAGAAAQGLVNALNWLGGAVSAVAPLLGVVVGVLALNAAVGAVAGGIGAAVAGITGVLALFSTTMAVVSASTAEGFGLMRVASVLFGTALQGSMLPITAILIAVAAVAVVLYTAWTHNWAGIRDVVVNAVNGILEWLGKLFAPLGAFLNALGAIAAPILGPLAEGVNGALGAMGKEAKNGLDTVSGVVGQGVSDIGDTFGDLGGTVKKAMSDVFGNITMPDLGITAAPVQVATNATTGLGVAADTAGASVQALKDRLDAAKDSVSATQDALSSAKEELQRFSNAALPGEWALQDRMGALDVQIANIKEGQSQKALDRLLKRPIRTPGQQLAVLELQRQIAGYQTTPYAEQHRQLQRLASDQVTMTYAQAAAGITASKSAVAGLEAELKARQNNVKSLETQIALEEKKTKLAQTGPVAQVSVAMPGELPEETALRLLTQANWAAKANPATAAERALLGLPGLGNTVPLTATSLVSPVQVQLYGGTTETAATTVPREIVLSVNVAVTGVGVELAKEIATQTEAAVRAGFQQLVGGGSQTQGAASSDLAGARGGSRAV